MFNPSFDDLDHVQSIVLFLGFSRFVFAFVGILWLIIGLILGSNWLINALELLSILFSINSYELSAS